MQDSSNSTAAPNGSPQGDRILTELLAALPRLKRLARRLADTSHEADDLLQSTCLRALDRRARLRSTENIAGWLVRVMKNLRIDDTRCPRHRKATVIIEELPAPSQRPIAPWRMVSDEALAVAVSHLEPTHRTTWTLADLQGVEHRDISEMLDVASATVGTRVYRARRALRRMLLESGDGHDRDLARPAGKIAALLRCHGDSQPESVGRLHAPTTIHP